MCEINDHIMSGLQKVLGPKSRKKEGNCLRKKLVGRLKHGNCTGN